MPAFNLENRSTRTISDFKSRLVGGGARPNLFEVEMTDLPAGIAWDASEFSFLCKASSLPASNVASIDIPFRGRIFKVAGDRTIDTWSVTIIQDEEFRIRNAFEQWTDLMANMDTNLGATNPGSYMRTAAVYQLGRGTSKRSSNSSGNTSAVLKAYEFENIFPTSVSSVDLSYDTGDTIEEFTVEFAVQSWNTLPTGAGGAGAGVNLITA